MPRVSLFNTKLWWQKLKTIKELFENKKSKEYYRVFHSGYGVIGEYYVAVLSSKNEQSYAKAADKNDALLGVEWQNALNNLLMVTDKYEPIVGMMRPDLSYAAKK